MNGVCCLINILWCQVVRASKTNTVTKCGFLKHKSQLDTQCWNIWGVMCLYSWFLMPNTQPCCCWWCHLWARFGEISKDTASENALSWLTLSRILILNSCIFPFLMSFFRFITPCHLPHFLHPHLQLYCLHQDQGLQDPFVLRVQLLCSTTKLRKATVTEFLCSCV